MKTSIATVRAQEPTFDCCCIDGVKQGVTKRCRLSWLTNSALVYEPKCGGEGGGGFCAGSHARCAHGAQINFGDLTPYLTYLTYRVKWFHSSDVGAADGIMWCRHGCRPLLYECCVVVAVVWMLWLLWVWILLYECSGLDAVVCWCCWFGCCGMVAKVWML